MKNEILNEIKRLKQETISLLIVVFSVVGVTAGYYVFDDSLFGPFKQISHTAYASGDFEVMAKSKFPAKSRLEYGTSPDYLNSLVINHGFENEHSAMVDWTLPKKHYFRLVLEDESGKTYLSDFYIVE